MDNGIIEIDTGNHQRHLFSVNDNAIIEDCCATCIYCRTIKTPEITGHSVDYVCQNKGSVIYDINIKNCDEMFLLRTPKVRGKANGKNLD